MDEQIIIDSQEQFETYYKSYKEASGIQRQQLEQALEPYRVKRAIILAAGFGFRMETVTKSIPKPLVPVHGVPLMKPLLDAVCDAGIEEIIVVCGYKMEQFRYLEEEYKNLRIVENKDYAVANNIGSVEKVADLLENSYVMEGDLLLNRKDLVRSHEYCSNYIGKPVTYTEDWCFQVDNGEIQSIHIGGKHCFHMYGISYWDQESGQRLGKAIRETYAKEQNRQLYWDEVAMKYYKPEFKVRIRPCSEGDIIELDTYEELQAIDSSYQ